MQIGIVTGLAAEAACLKRGTGDGIAVRCTGARAGAAAAAAAALIGEGCPGLISFGTAGGLVAGLAAGTLVLAGAVILPDGSRIAVDPAWHQRLGARLIPTLPLVTDAIAAADEPLLSAAAKARCHHATGAVGVDMESGQVAAAAAAAGVPFLVVRAIADPSERTVPSWVMQTITADGGTAIRPLISHLARNPADVRALVRLAGDARKALRSLRRAALVAGPLFHFDR